MPKRKAKNKAQPQNKPREDQGVEAKSKRSGGKESNWSVMSIISLLIFIVPTLIVVFMVVMPKIESINSLRNQIELTKQQQAFYKDKYERLAGFDVVNLEENLQYIDTFVPSQLTLAELAVLVNLTAESHQLKVSALSLEGRGTNYGSIATKTGLGSGVKEFEDIRVEDVSGPFSFQGDCEQIMLFVANLYEARYAIRFSEICLTRTLKKDEQVSANNDWNIQFNVLGYIMADVKSVPVKLPMPSLDKKLLEELPERDVNDVNQDLFKGEGTDVPSTTPLSLPSPSPTPENLPTVPL